MNIRGIKLLLPGGSTSVTIDEIFLLDRNEVITGVSIAPVRLKHADRLSIEIIDPAQVTEKDNDAA